MRTQEPNENSIAIIGSGFCGMAAAFLLSKEGYFVDVYSFDDGASSQAIGLLHPFTGKKAHRSSDASAAVMSAKKLLETASRYLQSPPYQSPGIYRLALTEEMEKDYRLCTEEFPNEVRWVEKEEVRQKLPQCIPVNGIFIKEGLAVYCGSYLEGLKKACEAQDARFIKRKIMNLNELQNYKKIIVAAGSGIIDDNLVLGSSLKKVKGQLLELAWPKHLPPLEFPISSNILAVMSENNKSCLVGATYERNYKSSGPDQEAAAKDLLPKIAELIPGLEKSSILNCRAGFRVTSPNRQPILKQIDDKTIVFGAMGSKGLLYHALYAEKLLKLIS